MVTLKVFINISDIAIVPHCEINPEFIPAQGSQYSIKTQNDKKKEGALATADMPLKDVKMSHATLEDNKMHACLNIRNII